MALSNFGDKTIRRESNGRKRREGWGERKSKTLAEWHPAHSRLLTSSATEAMGHGSQVLPLR